MDKKTIIEQINTLRKQKDVLILAHNYQNPGIQDIADHLGDSLELAKIASKTDVENIIFCGVVFMAESAKILNPDKNVIIPDITASCPMAAMVEAEPLRAKKEQHPDATVVAYINTTAEVKAESDICCTSSNGKKVVESVDAKEILFVPDINLGQYIKRFIDDKEMILWPGMCSTHHNITKEDIMKLKKIHPNSEILVHPECRPEIIDIADYAYSTNGMVNHVKKSDSDEFIIGTEKEMCYRLKKENPEKKFYPIDKAICENMKKITLEKLLKSIKNLEPKIKLSDEIIKKADIPLKRMMNIGRGD